MQISKKLKLLLSFLALVVIYGSFYVFVIKANPNKPAKPAPTASPTPNSTPSPTDSPSPTPTPSTSPTPTSTPSPTPTPAVKPTTRPTVTPLNQEVSRGNTDKKRIALTFDAGASATQTPSILNILDKNDIHATFFITGKWAEQNPTIVKSIVDAGHTLGNHTYSHKDLTTLTDAQIKQEFTKTEAIFRSISSKAIGKPYFRPPYGARNKHVWDYCASLGYQSIYWTVDALDWKEGTTAATVKQRIYSNAKNGAIIMMHVGDNLTPAVLQEVITKLQNDGYALGNLESVLN